ncbi:GvpT/GvpP family gas vesicle accessory protein [Metabacillus herbersteinensis]|uniref:GvpT/GvpP family gas vesicle accessory protein n=1 Tax=Metabacillus herbersteinensis TaxID=283816 RepID=A0ABV6GM36_9BACI
MAKDEQNEQKDKQEEQKDDKQNSLNLAILGGVVGAGIGLLSSPETGKKVITSLGQSEVMRATGRELKRTAQEIIAEQAMCHLRNTATGYLEKGNLSNLLASKKKKETSDREEAEESGKESSSQFDELKEENKKLNDQFERIEHKLNDLLDAKK